MTRLRRSAAVALTVGVIALSSAANALAQEAPQLERAWLAGQSRGPAGTTESKASLLGLLLLLGAAGGYFYVKRRKRQLVGIPSNVQVVGSARVGSKAHAVVTTVGGKVLVLGVTDHNVSLLTILDDARELARTAPTLPAPVEPRAAARGEQRSAAPVEQRAAARGERDLSAAAVAVAAPGEVFGESEYPRADVALAQTEYPEVGSTSEIIPGVPRKFRDMLRDVLSRPPKPPSEIPGAVTPPVAAAQASRRASWRASTRASAQVSTRADQSESPAEQIANVTVDFFERGRQIEKDTLQQRENARQADLPPPLEGQVAGLRRWRPGGPR